MSDYRLIPLTQGKVAKVDLEDFEAVNAHSWYVAHGTGYAARTKRNPGGKAAGKKVIYMHRIVLGAKPDQLVDHINGDRLDNRRSNLRVATSSENLANRRKSSRSTMLYKGIQRNRGRYQAIIVKDRKRYCLGTYDTQEEAARAYDQAAMRLFGEFAWINFPLNQVTQADLYTPPTDSRVFA